jgi:hypothetical protein
MSNPFRPFKAGLISFSGEALELASVGRLALDLSSIPPGLTVLDLAASSKPIDT